jgi:hypothetical protein
LFLIPVLFVLFVFVFVVGFVFVFGFVFFAALARLPPALGRSLVPSFFFCFSFCFFFALFLLELGSFALDLCSPPLLPFDRVPQQLTHLRQGPRALHGNAALPQGRPYLPRVHLFYHL